MAKVEFGLLEEVFEILKKTPLYDNVSEEKLLEVAATMILDQSINIWINLFEGNL